MHAHAAAFPAYTTNVAVSAPHFPTQAEMVDRACAQVLLGLRQTQQGVGKGWKNVQPCVMLASQLLLQQAQLHGERLCALESKMDEVQRAVEVLVNDSHLKEERYNAERTGTGVALEGVRRNMQQLKEAVEMQRCDTQKFHQEVLFPGMNDLQRQIDNVVARSLARSVLGAAQSLSPTASPGPGDSIPAETDNSVREMVREVKLLRNQWLKLLQRPLPPVRSTSGCHRCRRSGSAAEATTDRRGKGQASKRFLLDCSVARWRWRGANISSCGSSPDGPIPWGSLCVRRTATGEWVRLAASPDSRAAFAELSGGRAELPFVWRAERHPGVIELTRSGICRIVVCMIASNAAAASGRGCGHHSAATGTPSAVLRVNSSSVVTFYSSGSTCYTLRPVRGGSRSRLCGEGIAFATWTFSDYLLLPAGASVAVCTRGSTGACSVHEVLLELEFVSD
ncbi:hypothetical protein DPX39_040037900 [Trypanosoma brucei equiperdum]|uniref:Uncharacterized protein n=1 Tax=Trypanosoma brucei equiperdum TaxID=630700 RepID=A0A3L6L8M2_9TRYP|nr:hypothetical protein DPX39_040037900 [Trypanosoma brucei equiperdum]